MILLWYMSIIGISISSGPILSPKRISQALQSGFKPLTISQQEPSDYIQNLIPGNLLWSRNYDVVEILIPGMLNAQIENQPWKVDEYVSRSSNTMTRFRLASDFGSIGLLAHNEMIGLDFSELEIGQEIFLILADGSYQAFEVIERHNYQAITPDSVYSQFRSLDDPASILTSTQLFLKIYAREGGLILQTCIMHEDNPNWGRYFVIAVPSIRLLNRDLRIKQ
jgi:hypothetical protein